MKGAALEEPDFDALDEEREASMADEGGASGAEMEKQPSQPIGQLPFPEFVQQPSAWSKQLRASLMDRRVQAAGLSALAGVAIYAWRSRLKKTAG